METEVLIIGAGLAGLSAAYHLGKRDRIIVEADSAVGGLCKSTTVDGFTFDCTGHLIHFRSDEGRSSSRGCWGTASPNTSGRLPSSCRAGSRTTRSRRIPTGFPRKSSRNAFWDSSALCCANASQHISNFQDWILDTFGEGISNHFMTPYNEKLWQHDLHDIALDWVNWSIPKPDLEDVLNGALGIKNRQFGYNPVFYYPSEGGIGLLPEASRSTRRSFSTTPCNRCTSKNAPSRCRTASRFVTSTCSPRCRSMLC